MNNPKDLKAQFDARTRKWMDDHPYGTYQVTVMRCDECGLYYKPSLGHMCKKGKNVWQKQ